ncbi:hypothetical protein [Polaromonas sp. UC242_47]|uniref:hypothetical protein n=1 Tax=Polaromonas sp. UC242_47 TaxID=3374626 RepID=UPI00378FD964
MSKKNYQVSPDRIVIASGEQAPGLIFSEHPPAARIDMRALLGDDARFSRNERILEFTGWLERGIDPWVWAAVEVLRSILLSGTRETSTVTGYKVFLQYFFRFLTEGRTFPRVASPAELTSLHVQEFSGWLRKQGQLNRWSTDTARKCFCAVKAVLLEMFVQGLVPGEPKRYFFRGVLPWDFSSKQTAMSEAEQERLAQALKQDLIEVYHGRLTLSRRDIQAVRLLLVAIRQGCTPTPLLEIRRDAVAPGLLPGTIRIRTFKHRGRKVRSGIGRSMPDATEEDMAFALSEGAVLNRAIDDSKELVSEAPAQYKDRIWLYRSQSPRHGYKVTCLTRETLQVAISSLIKRRDLRGDDGKSLKLNLSRLRKSYFERSFRHADGDLVITANLMGNTPSVAGSNYAIMNEHRKAEAAEFMNGDFTAFMRATDSINGGDACSNHLQVIPIKPFEGGSRRAPTQTALASCQDTRMGANAPRDGHNHCDRYVMCLFCPSFAVVGEVDELWRLFSFQVFASEELDHLDGTLGPQRTDDAVLEEMRDRYCLAIPYIDDFTKRQFAASRVGDARSKTAVGLHPYWVHQIHMSRKARGSGSGTLGDQSFVRGALPSWVITPSMPGDTIEGVVTVATGIGSQEGHHDT